MKTVPVTEVELFNIIRSLKDKKPSGYDDVSNKIVKLYRSVISKPLLFIFKSISFGMFPERLKYTVVRLINKKEDKSLI